VKLYRDFQITDLPPILELLSLTCATAASKTLVGNMRSVLQFLSHRILGQFSCTVIWVDDHGRSFEFMDPCWNSSLMSVS